MNIIKVLLEHGADVLCKDKGGLVSVRLLPCQVSECRSRERSFRFRCTMLLPMDVSSMHSLVHTFAFVSLDYEVAELLIHVSRRFHLRFWNLQHTNSMSSMVLKSIRSIYGSTLLFMKLPRKLVLMCVLCCLAMALIPHWEIAMARQLWTLLPVENYAIKYSVRSHASRHALTSVI